MTSLSRPLFKYFGSKFQIARYYPRPMYPRIDEHCAGSATYASRYPELEIVLHEIDPEIAGLWSWLIVADPDEIMSLPLETLREGMDMRELGLRKEAAELLRRWQRVGRNDCWTVSKWGHLPGQWTRSTRKAIAKNVQRIRHWKILNASWDATPPVESTHFVDPPYQHVPRSAYRFTKIDYPALAKFCQTAPGQVIVCEQQGADWLPFVPFLTIAARCAASRKPGAKSREVIWTNQTQAQGVLL